MGDQEDAIRLYAYQIWESEGRPEGRDTQHWRQAEEELGAGLSPFPTPTVVSAIPQAPAGLEADPDAFEHSETRPDIEVTKTGASTSIRKADL